MVSWAVVAGTRTEEGIRLGGFCLVDCGKRLQSAREAMAMVQLLAHKGPAFVISDSRVAISQAESKIFKASHWPVWADVHDRHRPCVEWIGSHQRKEAYALENG